MTHSWVHPGKVMVAQPSYAMACLLMDELLIRSQTASSALVQECHKYPQLAEIAARVPPDAQLSKEQFQAHLQELDKSLRSLPATAQVCMPTLVEGCSPQDVHQACDLDDTLSIRLGKRH